MPQIARTSREDKKGLTEKGPEDKVTGDDSVWELEAERGPSQQLINEVEPRDPQGQLPNGPRWEG